MSSQDGGGVNSIYLATCIFHDVMMAEVSVALSSPFLICYSTGSITQLIFAREQGVW